MGNKKDNQFFWKISEEDMKDTNLYITEDSKPIGAWKQAQLDANWEAWKKDWAIRQEKHKMTSSVAGVVYGVLGTGFSYASSTWAFSAIDSSYADQANFYIGTSGVIFGMLAGFSFYTIIKSSFDWFYARKKLHELGN